MKQDSPSNPKLQTSNPILFTAFEPSGDALAASLIAELRRRDPDRPVYALGGPRMRDAGAHLIETTTQQAVMGVGAAGHIAEHRRRIGRLRTWMRERHGGELAAVIPTDSPAANWSVCKATRQLQPQAKILHLAAPQLWAWASWRIGRMRRLSDHVMCLLPFEPAWFEQRGVSATFVGHPIFDAADHVNHAPVTSDEPPLPRGEPKLALLPGSRASEVRANWPVMLETWRCLKASHPQLCATIAAADPERAHEVKQHLSPPGRLPEDMQMMVGDMPRVVDWADVVLAVSGTATLHVAARHKPMVILYRVNPLAWHGVGRWLISTRTFTLPNLIGDALGFERAVPELVPHFGAVEPVVEAMEPLMAQGDARDRQRRLFEAIERTYAGASFAQTAADVVEKCVAVSR